MDPVRLYAGPAPLDLTTGAWVDLDLSRERAADLVDDDAVWPSGDTAGSVVSPSGRECGTLPSASRLQSWVRSLGAGPNTYSVYSDDYALAMSPPAYIGMRGVSEDEYLSIAESVAWARGIDDGIIAAAVGVLDSDLSAEVIDQLSDPLAFLSRRLVVEVERTALGGDPDDGTLRARIPLVDLVTTPLTRVLRRFQPLDEQVGERIKRSAIDDETQELFDKIWVGVGLDFTSSSIVLPDQIELSFEDIDDRVYNPVIGTISTSSPFMDGLWGGGGIVGLVLDLLMPQRSAPAVYAYPLNWGANNLAEFLGTMFEWIDGLDEFIASHNAAVGLTHVTNVTEWLESYGISEASSLDTLRADLEGADGHVVVMTADVSGLLLADLLEKIEDARDTLGLSSADEADTGDGIDPISEWVDPIVVAATAMAPWIWIPYLILDEDLEDAATDVAAALDSAITTLVDGLTEASEQGRSLNDAFVIALMAAGTSFEEVRSVMVSGFLKKDFGDTLRLSEAMEEKLLLGLDTSNHRALVAGLAGDWYEAWLTEGEALAAGLPSALGNELSNAIDDLRAQHEAAVPVYTLDESFTNWQFDDFEPYPWYLHQSVVTVYASGDLASSSSSGTERDLAAWVEAASPLMQLVLSIEAASATLEAGLQAENFLLALSGLPTGDDSMAQQVLSAFGALGMGSIQQVLPGISVPRFIAAVWRQAMADRLLLELEAGGYDMDCVYEVVRWMRTSTYRDQIDTLLGPLDAELGRRRYEEGLVGTLGRYGKLSEESIEPDKWLLYSSLDEAWAALSCEEREAWSQALPYLVDRSRLQDLVDLVAATRSDSGSVPGELDVIDVSDMIEPRRGSLDIIEERLDDSVLLDLERLERLTRDTSLLGLEREVLIGDVLFLGDVAVAGSTTEWEEVLADGELFTAERWVAMAEGMGSARATMLRTWVGVL